MPQRPFALLDLDNLLTDEQRMIRDTVRQYVDDRIRPDIADWFERGTLPAAELALEMGEIGLLGMHLQGYECAGTDAISYGLANLELEAGDSGLRSLVSVQGSLAMFAIHHWGSEEQKQEWLPRMARGEVIGCFGLTEPDFGSNPSGMRTFAKRDGDDWVLNGTKMWITSGTVAGVAVVWANTEEGIRGFIVPTSVKGFTANEIHKKMSLRASVTAELVLDNVRLPASAMLPSARGLRGPLTCLGEARFGIIWGVLGAARDCLETAIDYSLTRVQFDRPIGGFQLTQRKLAEMAVSLDTGYLLAHRIGVMKDAGEVRPETISVGKFNNAKAAIEIARECRSILGGNGITLEYPIIRHANNLEAVLTYEGTHEIHTLVIGEALTGLAAYQG
jgi:glutaryl-CoA dehydrogenase